MMKQYKLVVHQKSFNEEGLIINPKDFPDVKIGDIFEIYLPVDDYSRLLLQVTSLHDDFQQKDTISVEQSIANSFQLRAYAEVIVHQIDSKDVALDSVELIFKDQYLARSDMWRLKNSLVNTCVHMNKKIEFSAIRCQVFEMWAQGERVACGVVSEDTKVIFRSASSMVYLFIQMSAEMWDFDINGDLYFEKAVNGFLSDLFAKWKRMNCNHDVTIVLFSRTFYEASHIEDFPLHTRECLQRDYKGRFYEDFYRVAVQNERYEDWNGTLNLLKKLFNEYQNLVLKHHHRSGIKVPQAFNSTSSQGNFLEVLNMSLNVFEKHYMDRSFDRTGQLSVVISPGVGVFEVDREFHNITKQRIIDNGIGSDLVCLGEQPLHAVPLFKFHNKQQSMTAFNSADDYNMPHWINLSFYSSVKQLTNSNFVPRIKFPSAIRKEDRLKALQKVKESKRSRHISQPEHSFPSVFDYDEYDAQVFKLPANSQSKGGTNSLQRSENRRKLTSPAGGLRSSSRMTNLRNSRVSDDIVGPSFHVRSEPLPASSLSSNGLYLPTRTAAISIPQRDKNGSSEKLESFVRVASNDDYENVHHSFQHTHQQWNDSRKQSSRIAQDSGDITPPSSIRYVVGSAPSPNNHPNILKQAVSKKPRALVNPFDPSHVTIKLTSNRRRWTHVFPLGPTGIFMQQHHYQAVPQNTASTLLPATINRGSHDLLPLVSLPKLHKQINFESQHYNAQPTFNSRFHFEEVNSDDRKAVPRTFSVQASSSMASFDPMSDKNMTWLWGASEQEWTPALTTGVDWKSLVIPACLPITTDYFPDSRSLQAFFGINEYFIHPDCIDLSQSRCYRSEEDHVHHLPPFTPQVFQELICQRLQQGFQIILLPKNHPYYPHTQVPCSPQVTPAVVRGNTIPEESEEYLLSIGRLFHKLTLEGSNIKVTQYRPRHPLPTININYCYRFKAPENDTYGVSWVDFSGDKLETFTWNHLDHYICERGLGDYELKENLKFWRLRLLLLPGAQAATRTIMEGINNPCDIYRSATEEELSQQKEGFLKFLEIMNKIRRPTVPKKNLKLSNKLASLQGRRFSVGQSSFAPQSSGQIGIAGNKNSNIMSYRDRVSSTGNRLRSSTKAMERVKGETAECVTSASEAENKLTHSGSNPSLEVSQDTGSDDNHQIDLKKISVNSTPQEVVEAMKHPNNGISFLKQTGLPPWTFVSTEAVQWVKDHMEGINTDFQSLKLLESMQNNFITHSSGVPRTFTNGFFLYCLVSNDKSCASSNEEPDAEMFSKEWMEVEIPLEISTSTFKPLESWEMELERENMESTEDDLIKNLKFKISNLDIHFATKHTTERLEWGHVKYHSHFKPYMAYEIDLEWMVATGNFIAELVLSWARKAASMCLHLVPIPSDPFTLPSSSKSDPLRGPIFIPLLLEALKNPTPDLTNELETRSLQEKILKSFGFLCHWTPGLNGDQQQYVHTSGSVFVILLPSLTSGNAQLYKKTNYSGSSIMRRIESPVLPLEDSLCSPHEEYITRHFSGKKSKINALTSSAETRIGFLFSYNYMITKRWKTAATGDEHFMRKILMDFKAFCANDNNRLQDFLSNQLFEDVAFNECLSPIEDIFL